MRSELRNWGEILRTQNLAPGRVMDPISRWLLIVRAGLLPLSLVPAAIGGLLAADHPDARWGCFAIAVFALVLAQAAGNLIHDYIDFESRIDADEYRRSQNAPHPILSGLIPKTGFILAIAVADLLALGAVLALTEIQGWPVAAFALLALGIGVAYAAPPLQLKNRGLGEAAIALIWGPLMVGGSYYATTGDLEPWVLVVSLPYSLLIAALLIAKHIDELDLDSERGIATLPVRIGLDRALFLNQGLMVLFFVFAISLVLVGRIGVWVLLVIAAARPLWRALRIHAQPRPSAEPPGCAYWPLWYAAPVFRLTRTAGALLVLGLLVDAIIPIRLG